MTDMPSDDAVELRGPCPRAIVDVLDAVSASRNLTRMQLVNEVLGEYARQRRHEWMVAARVLRLNPAGVEEGAK